MARLNIERQEKLQPIRFQYAFDEISKLGYEVEKIDDTLLKFKFKGEVVKLFPYSGWHTGRSIKDGRGIENLLKQIKQC